MLCGSCLETLTFIDIYRYSDSRNRPGANLSDIALFNEIISYLGLIELPIKGRSFTWSNMQAEPLLVQLDWFFTSAAWTIKFPNTLVNPLARPTSDHVPCVVSIGTSIPKAQVFRFENHWIKMPGFLEVVQRIWSIQCPGDSAKCISSKFKLLRKALRNWSTSISVINRLVENCNSIISMLDNFEEARTLHISEWNFRNIVKNKLHFLLDCKQQYWKMRCTTKWAKFGSENTSFFHSMATIRFRKNLFHRLHVRMDRLLLNTMKKPAFFGKLSVIVLGFRPRSTLHLISLSSCTLLIILVTYLGLSQAMRLIKW